jgi:hypothetical protein
VPPRRLMPHGALWLQLPGTSSDHEESMRTARTPTATLRAVGAGLLCSCSSDSAAKPSATLDGFVGTMVVWQKGSLVGFNRSFRDVATAKKVLTARKSDGSATLVRLTTEGVDV